MLKLNKLLYLTSEREVFSDRIAPSKLQRQFLVDCKNLVRDYLRPRIREATVSILGMDHPIEPRFRTQGSWSYKTCIQPCFMPEQEMDWDYGVYLPVSVWEENGSPKVMAKAYFDLVEGLLQELCFEKNWTLINKKDTCIRIQVAPWAHIDIPLYAAPEDEFLQILEKASVGLEGHSIIDSLKRAEEDEFLSQDQEWDELDHIALATRSGEWKESDPEAVARWFNDRAAEFTPQLLRICRYLKAWRDYNWADGGGPTSVAIMIAVAQAFEPVPNRDDLALQTSALHLSKALAGEIREVGIDEGKEDFNRLKADERIVASQKASNLAKAIAQARSLDLTTSPTAIELLILHLGNRIPDDVTLVNADNQADEIRLIPAKIVAPPIVHATKAG